MSVRTTGPELRSQGRRRDVAGERGESFWFAAEASSLRAVRDYVDRATEAFGMEDDSRQAFKIAANEAATNAIEHGHPCDGGILVEAAERGDALVLNVTDCGEFQPELELTEELPERGRGLLLIAAMVDSVELIPDERRTTIRLEKRREPGGVASTPD